jgi:hypothetical protein
VNPDFTLWLNQLIDPVVEKRFPTAREALNALYMIPMLPAVKTSARRKGGSEERICSIVLFIMMMFFVVLGMIIFLYFLLSFLATLDWR